MQCSCATTTLVAFIRSVAHFDIETPIRCATNRHLFSLSRNKIIGYQHQQIHYGTHLRKSSGAQIQPDLAPSNEEKVSGISRKWPLETALVESLDFKAHATNGTNEQSSSKRDLKQHLVSTKSNTGTARFDPKKDLIFWDRNFNNREEAPVLEIDPEGIGGGSNLVTRQLQNAQQEKQPVHNFHDVILPNMKPNFGISLSTGAPAMKIGRRERHDLGGNYSRFVSSVDEHNSSVTSREPWQVQKAALTEKFKDGWSPRKRLSPDALAGIRAIHAQFPDLYPTCVLAEKFEVSPEAIRRILKSKWTPKEEEELDRQRRWFSRGRKVWSRYAELGLKPPIRWRKLGIGKRGDLVNKGRKRSRAGTKITLRNADLKVTGPVNGLRENSLSGRIL